MGTKLDPHTKKITLMEIDSLAVQAVWFNWTAYVWYVDFDAIYDLIDPAFLVGVSAQGIPLVGSVRVDSSLITPVGSIASVISTPSSFFYDPSTRRVYIQIAGGSEPSLHAIKLGITAGLSNIACILNGVYYEPRIKSLPTLSKSKDPLFFGRISMGSNAIAIDNTDGQYDMIGENQSALFGSEVRILQGFDSDPYASFVRLATRMIENARVSRDSVEFDCVDKRKGLTVSVPKNVFSSITYPDIDLNDIGKPIPLVYGKVYNIPVVCVNRGALGPASFSFKLADTAGAGHGIKSIDSVYVKGVSVTPSSSSLANATFELLRCSGATTTTTAGKLVAAAGNFIVNGVEAGDYVYNLTDGKSAKVVTVDSATQLSVDADVFPTGKNYILYPYTPGDEVAVTMTGFESGGVAIANPADVILDLLNTWLGISYIAANFNTVEWAAVTALLAATFPGGIGMFLDSSTEVYAIVQDICASFALNFIPQDDGKFTLRMYDAARAVSQDFAVADLMDVPDYEYDTSQLISYTCIEYARNWKTGNPRRLMDTSQDAAIYAIYNKRVLGTFTTLLTTAADAQALSTIILGIQGAALRKFTAKFKMQPFDREIMDFITLYLNRPTHTMIGRVKAEILSKTITASKEVVLGCRIVASI